MRFARQIVRELLTATVPSHWWFARGSRNSGSIWLTFDDGPHPEQTPRVLDALSRWNAQGTFFVVGQQAERHPEIIDRILQEGHAIGNHTWTHSEPTATTTSTFLGEVEKTDRWLEEHLEMRPHWVRPPKGELTWAKLKGLWSQRHGIALWNVDPRDYRISDLDLARQWAMNCLVEAGDIILLHDRCEAASVIVETLGGRGVFSEFSARPLPTPVSYEMTRAAADGK